MSAKSQIPFTYEDYKALPESRDRYELIDGEFYVTPAPTTTHQIVSKNIQFALESHVRRTGSGIVLNAPADVVLGSGSKRDVVQPDLLFIDRDRRQILTEAEIAGAPDLVIEILSRTTRKRDRGLKKTVYSRAGVREYWLVDVGRQLIDVFDLTAGADKKKRFTLGDELVSVVVPGLRLPLSEAFRPPFERPAPRPPRRRER
jgi:Uma2 family endonuclease